MRAKKGNGSGAFARKLLAEWRGLGLPREGAGVVVAASGGADSTALLLALAELRGRGLLSVELKAAHLDHGLRGEAGADDARWVEGLARGLGCGFESARAAVAQRARESRDNVEQAARRERYEFLARIAREWGAQLIVTGHTLDDQAETVLLALLRGSGADGLSGMEPVRPISEGETSVLLARPLLGWARRAETEGYCEARGVCAREDAMNEDESFARVRLRRRVLPLLETFNPRAVEAVARAAGLLRADAEALGREARQLLGEAADEGAQPRPGEGDGRAGESSERGASEVVPPLRVGALAAAMPAVRRRALREWLARARGDLRRVELAHVVAVEKLLEGGRGGRVAELPGGGRVERRGRWIFFRGAASEGGGG
ncbi:MAG TPA: tRNA lysidine(34) synthetase TilS [Pyrinomonadaceae bacterium]|nr:tRNA lysidine(34) synthetase TilS [Pyrinomonadaceae bacterium]